MSAKCDQCGEFAMDEEEDVCRSCGFVTDGIKINFSSAAQGTSYKPHVVNQTSTAARIILRKSKPPIAFTYGLDSLKNLCHVFSIPKERESEATEMLKNVYKARRYKTKEDVGIIGGCCLFILQRRNNQSITLNEMCHQLQCTKKKFAYLLKFLKSWMSSNDLRNNFSSVDEEDGLFGQCDKREEMDDPSLPDIAKSLISDICEKVPEDEKDRLAKKTSSLVKLAYSCWLFTGRSPRTVVVACTFLCWKSMHPSRKKTSFARFCKLLKIIEQGAKLRVAELKAFLLKLGRMIPSYSKNYVNEDNLLFHLDTILENSETLRNDLLENEVSEHQINTKEFKTFRAPPRNSPRIISETAINYDTDMNASDIEISDTEIESYIIHGAHKKAIENLCEKGVSKCPS